MIYEIHLFAFKSSHKPAIPYKSNKDHEYFLMWTGCNTTRVKNIWLLCTCCWSYKCYFFYLVLWVLWFLQIAVCRGTSAPAALIIPIRSHLDTGSPNTRSTVQIQNLRDSLGSSRVTRNNYWSKTNNSLEIFCSIAFIYISTVDSSLSMYSLRKLFTKQYEQFLVCKQFILTTVIWLEFD